jgi:hypothetical protein
MPLGAASRRTLNPCDIEGVDQTLGRQAELPVVADPRLPTVRCPLVKDVVDEDSVRLVLQEAREDAGVVAPDGNEALVSNQRHGVVPQRDDEDAAARQRCGNAFDEAVDGAGFGQMVIVSPMHRIAAGGS